jgi:dTDP-4-dehydrorhamnose 3,5-epimerase
MNRIETELPGVWLIEPAVHADARGSFSEVYRESVFRKLGITARFVQDNIVHSVQNVVRGLHYQIRFPQAKLCRVLHGAVVDVVVDVRRGSPHFGKWIRAELSASNQRMIFIPRGFAHGYAVRSPSADFLYKCDDEYRAGDEYGVAWNDPDLAIPWGVVDPIVSDRDRACPRLREVPADKLAPYQTMRTVRTRHNATLRSNREAAGKAHRDGMLF